MKTTRKTGSTNQLQEHVISMRNQRFLMKRQPPKKTEPGGGVIFFHCFLSIFPETEGVRKSERKCWFPSPCTLIKTPWLKHPAGPQFYGLECFTTCDDIVYLGVLPQDSSYHQGTRVSIRMAGDPYNKLSFTTGILGLATPISKPTHHMQKFHKVTLQSIEDHTILDHLVHA